MSTLETNNISKYNGNNVSMGDALRLKSYTTTQRNALTSATGDTIYNSTDSKVQVYNGSSWDDLGGAKVVTVDYLIILSWNIKNEIIKQEKNFIKKGGKFIIPFPRPKILN